MSILTERGLAPTKEFPKPIDGDVARTADVIVTMGCGDTCPVYPGKRYLDWELADPAGEPLEKVRTIVEEIDRRVQVLLAELVPDVEHILVAKEPRGRHLLDENPFTPDSRSRPAREP